MIAVRRLGHATLTTPDLDAQVALLHRDRRPDPDRSATERARSLRPGRASKRSRSRRRCGDALIRLAFQVAPGSDLGELARELAKHGIRSERRSGISPGVADAHGVSRTPRARCIESIADYAFSPEDGSQVGIMPLKLGHVAYRVTDVQQSSSSIPRSWASGFRTGTTTVCVPALRSRPSHRQFRASTTRRSSITSHSRSRTGREIQRACEWLAKNDIRLVWGPGRHIIGHNIAIYHRNADNVRVEFFCRDGPDERRVARLFRSAPVASGPAAAAEGVAAGHAAQLLGLRLRAGHPRLPDGGVKARQPRSCPPTGPVRSDWGRWFRACNSRRGGRSLR